MAIDEKEQDQIDDMRISRDRAITVRSWIVTVLIGSAAIAALAIAVGVIVGLIYGIPALKSWKQASDATAKTYTESLPDASEKIVAVLDKASSTMTRLDAVAGNVERLTDGLASDIPPTLQSVQRVTAALERQVESNGSATTALITDTNQRINGDSGLLPEITGTITDLRALTQTEVKNAIAELAASGRNIRVLTESAEFQNLPKEVDALLKSLNRTGGQVEVIASNMAGVTDDVHKISTDLFGYTHNLLYPPKPVGFWPKFKHYSLRTLGVIKDLGGTTFVLLKIANAVN